VWFLDCGGIGGRAGWGFGGWRTRVEPKRCADGGPGDPPYVLRSAEGSDPASANDPFRCIQLPRDSLRFEMGGAIMALELAWLDGAMSRGDKSRPMTSNRVLPS